MPCGLNFSKILMIPLNYEAIVIGVQIDTRRNLFQANETITHASFISFNSSVRSIPRYCIVTSPASLTSSNFVRGFMMFLNVKTHQ